MGFFSFILLIVFLFFFIILFSGISIIRGIFGLFSSKRTRSNQYSEEKNEEEVSVQKDHKKIFSDKDGEYIDFEEIEE